MLPRCLLKNKTNLVALISTPRRFNLWSTNVNRLSACLFDRSTQHWRRPSEWHLGWRCAAGWRGSHHAPPEVPGPSFLAFEWRLDPAPCRVGGTGEAKSRQIQIFHVGILIWKWMVSHRSHKIVELLFHHFCDFCVGVFAKDRKISVGLATWHVRASEVTKNNWGQMSIRSWDVFLVELLTSKFHHFYYCHPFAGWPGKFEKFLWKKCHYRKIPNACLRHHFTAGPTKHIACCWRM